ncbi:PspC domain-containing protein [Pseudohongiella sp.]|uniref:Phage shock protein PspC N-terminal domain-containing protein n=1 Tax=marine sediment metagenome TaxID=412755 RepID=A0A0F9W3Q3_9ZZZZ|nr:PspC domain-containing protein [Pseudohongiella sp.]HDZ09573.1 PspC domain-containing protein [Pseudohongiella sp.]HEA62487.1 PspC domain-containing protein [Pseudohongiella sp.]
MSNNTESDTAYRNTRAPLTLDRENRKVLGVCGGFARYLEVPSALVRVIYCVACLASPFLIIVYFVMYWLLDDEERPARIKAAMGGKAKTAGFVDKSTRQAAAGADPVTPDVEAEPETETEAQTPRFDLKKPLYRSRSNARIAGVCAGVADYLGISTFLVRLVTFLSLFIVGAVTLWGYIIFWIVLDKEPKGRKVSGRRGRRNSGEQAQTTDEETDNGLDIETCHNALRAAERKLQDVEAFITSKQFRLHCEINRI